MEPQDVDNKDENNNETSNGGGEKTPAANEKTPLESLPEDVQAYIRELREESKTHRQANEKLQGEFTGFRERLQGALGGEKEQDPEQALQELKEQNLMLSEELEARQAKAEIASFAAQSGIPNDKVGYFEYLLNEAANNIGEEDELPDEVLTDIVNKVLAVSGTNKKASTTPGEGQDAQETGGGATDGVTYEDFKAMGIMDRQKLYKENESLYMTYMDKARAKGELVT